MNKSIMSVALLSFYLMSSHAAAVTVDASTYKKNGGNMRNVKGDVSDKNVLKDLRDKSYADAWKSVGTIHSSKSTCSATWLGEDEKWSYLLTAANCLPFEDKSTSIVATYTGWDKAVVAQGWGMAYVPAELFDPEFALSQTSADIAIVKLPRRQSPRDGSGDVLERPILNDVPDEVGATVVFVGQETWGAADKGYEFRTSRDGDARLYGRSVATGVHGQHMLLAKYDPYGPSPHWAMASDFGSAWWQFQRGKPVIAAVSAGTFPTWSQGPRVSQHIEWIREIYPDARLLSAEKPRGCLVLAGGSKQQSRRKYCLSAGENSGRDLPDWMSGRAVEVQADPGATVILSDMDNLVHHRTARFSGNVGKAALRRAKADGGEYLDFSKPRFMAVEAADAPALGCVVSLETADKYCLPAGDTAAQRLPKWIRGHEIFVQAAPGVSVVLSNKKYSQGHAFQGTVQNHELERVALPDGKYADLSKAVSIAVIKP